MNIGLGEYEDRNHLKEKIDSFSAKQLESLNYYMKVLEHGNNEPAGKVIGGFLNITTKSTGEKTTESTLPLRWELYNGQGILHGGITATFIDIVMGRTLIMCYPGELEGQVTVDLNIHYIKGGTGKELIATTELLQAGKSITVLDCKVRDDKGELVSKATGTFKVWRKK